MIISLAGRRVGRLTPLRFEKRNGKQGWRCRCRCGTEKWVRGDHLREGRVRSCGCLLRDNHRPRLQKHGHCKHDRETREYKSWMTMRQRCGNPNAPDFDRYGGRGIKVCRRWRGSFENFLADMGKRPNGKTLDRIDNGKGYSKTNCRWASPKQQANNRRRSV